MKTFLTVVLLVACTAGSIPLSIVWSAEEQLQDEYLLRGRRRYPEGVTFDPAARFFYAGSLNGGTISRVAADGDETVFSAFHFGASLTGMKVDALNRRLWVCAGFTDYTVPFGEEGSRIGEVWVFDLETGEKTSAYLLTACAPYARCNDLILDESGRAYVPDPSRPNVYRIDPAEDACALFASDQLLEPEFTLEGVPRLVVPGSNGCAITPEGRWLLVANTYANTLFRIAMQDPEDIAEVSLSGDAFSLPDGLVMLGETLYAVSDARIHRVTFTDDSFSAGTVKSIDFQSGLSTGTAAEGALYVIKSEVSAIIEAGTEGGLPDPDLPFTILRVDLNLFE